MKNIRRKSIQRERIFELINTSREHPTAQTIYEILKNEIKTLSIGNVYRNIRILIEQRLITSRDFGDGIEHFDAITDSHYHFICDSCKTVTDFNMPIQDSLSVLAQQISGHTVTGHTIQFSGICENCKKRRKPVQTENR